MDSVESKFIEYLNDKNLLFNQWIDIPENEKPTLNENRTRDDINKYKEELKKWQQSFINYVYFQKNNYNIVLKDLLNVSPKRGLKGRIKEGLDYVLNVGPKRGLKGRIKEGLDYVLNVGPKRGLKTNLKRRLKDVPDVVQNVVQNKFFPTFFFSNFLFLKLFL
jgi:hypothetical protein